MAYAAQANVVTLPQNDAFYARLRVEAEETIAREPEIAGLIFSTIINHTSLEAVIIHRIAARIGHPDVPGDLIRHTYLDVIEKDPSIGEAFRADVAAVYERDPACKRLLEPILFFKGFHAIQTYRLAHALWMSGRKDFALYLQSRSSEVFQTDIHPAARFGKGIFLDHATGLVVGSTAVIDNDVSILHDVTLGGTGKESGDRHPKIRSGVMLGAGAKILGNIEIGRCCRIAAGSVVLQPVPDHKTVAGVPARIIGEAGCSEPSRAMDQLFGDGVTLGLANKGKGCADGEGALN